MSDELELAEILATLDIRGAVALQMLADPVRARAVIEHAHQARGIIHPVAYAIANWKSGFDPRPAVTEPVVAAPPDEWFEFGRRLGAMRRA